MFKLRLIFIASLVILAGLFIAVIYLVPSSQTRQESKRAQLIKGETGWILQYDIVNNKDREISYTILVTVDEATRRDSAVVQPGKTYTYTYQIPPNKLGEGKVTFALYQEDIAEPIEQTTYYISNNR